MSVSDTSRSEASNNGSISFSVIFILMFLRTNPIAESMFQNTNMISFRHIGRKSGLTAPGRRPHLPRVKSTTKTALSVSAFVSERTPFANVQQFVSATRSRVSSSTVTAATA